jgi:outer membrane protein assembly factor BamB/type II secretory pathway pseudopilin PulG
MVYPVNQVPKQKREGYSLLELSISILIIGLLTTGGLTLLSEEYKENKRNLTRDEMREIDDGLAVYLRENDKLPCPASLTALEGSAEYGRETDCTDTTPPTGTYRVEHPSGSGTYVRVGAVPFYDMEMPDEYLADAWLGRYVYAVSEPLTTSTTSSSVGNITIKDAGSDITTEAAWSLISIGKDNAGAYAARSSNQILPCNSGTMDEENCDYSDGEFRDTVFNDGSVTANFFDDQIRWKTVALMFSGAGSSSGLPSCSSGETIEYDGSDWTCTTGSSGAPSDVKYTTSSSTGNFGGYSGLQTFLDSNGCSGYKICTSENVFQYVRNGNDLHAVIDPLSAGARLWMLNDNADDCEAWQYDGSSGYGATLSVFTGNVESKSWSMIAERYCSNSYPVLCCQFSATGGGGGGGSCTSGEFKPTGDFPTAYSVVMMGSDDQTHYQVAMSDGTTNWSNTDPTSDANQAAWDTSGNIYIASDDDNVRMLNSSGATQWTQNLGNDVKGIAWAPTGDFLYAGTGGAGTTLYKLNASDGTTVWTYSAPGAIRDVIVDKDENVLIAVDHTTSVIKLAPDKTVAWSYTDHERGEQLDTDQDGHVYMATREDHVVKINGSLGTQMWESADLGSDVTGVAAQHNASTTTGYVYGAEKNGTLFVLNASDGTTVTSWSTGFAGTSKIATDPEGNVYVTDDDTGGVMKKYAEDGTLAWSQTVAGDTSSGPSTPKWCP